MQLKWRKKEKIEKYNKFVAYADQIHNKKDLLPLYKQKYEGKPQGEVLLWLPLHENKLRRLVEGEVASEFETRVYANAMKT